MIPRWLSLAAAVVSLVMAFYMTALGDHKGAAYAGVFCLINILVVAMGRDD